MMAKKSEKIKTFVEEGLKGLTEAVVSEFEEFLGLIAFGNILLCWQVRMSAFETMMMAKKSEKIKTFVEEGLYL